MTRKDMCTFAAEKYFEKGAKPRFRGEKTRQKLNFVKFKV